ncbi:MAG: hypothetical protein CSB15_01685 [Clostridiales bacterium]|nr:MAG: hypothetical protein CSB15_01685 [Clostridiales bacterium]
MNSFLNESYLYVHIPFCRRRCSYCSFYAVVSDALQDEFVECLVKEIKLLSLKYKVKLKTVYFGGGTPSYLSIDNLSKIMNAIKNNFILENAEVTIEINPEDVENDFAKSIKNIGFNRVSMGVQSSNVKLLKLLNREANFSVVENSLSKLRNVGFNNISLDIMYGLPNSDLKMLIQSVKHILSLSPEHISIYCLTLEDKTVLKRKVDLGVANMQSQEKIENEYEFLLSELKNKGYKRYEISNFCKNDLKSIHNSSYWKYHNTLGVGPSACYKYDNVRYENISNIKKYINLVNNGDLPIGNKIILSNFELFIESIFMGLRQVDGINYLYLKNYYKIADDIEIQKWIKKYVSKNLMEYNGENLKFTEYGLDISNSILCDLF